MLRVVKVSGRGRGNVDAMRGLRRRGRWRRRRRDVGAMIGIVGVHITRSVIIQVLLLLRNEIRVSKGCSSRSRACRRRRIAGRKSRIR